MRSLHPEIESVYGSLRMVRGWWWDEFYRRDASGVPRLSHRTPVVHNDIMAATGVLLAGLMANDAGFSGGILYHAIGEGDSGWDVGAIPTPSTSNTTLEAEVAREAPDSIAYVDVDGNPVVGRSAFIEVTTTFDFGTPASPFNDKYIREQGLFGGDATSALDSGIIVDVIRHPKVWKDDTFRWIRHIRLGL